MDCHKKCEFKQEKCNLWSLQLATEIHNTLVEN